MVPAGASSLLSITPKLSFSLAATHLLCIRTEVAGGKEKLQGPRESWETHRSGVQECVCVLESGGRRGHGADTQDKVLAPIPDKYDSQEQQRLLQTLSSADLRLKTNGMFHSGGWHSKSGTLIVNSSSGIFSYLWQ